MNKLLLLFSLWLPFSLLGQQKVEIGGFAGFANYQGDLAPNPVEFSETKLSLGGFIRYHLKDQVKIRVNGILGFISGSDFNDKNGDLRQRGWSFKSDIFEFSIVGEYHPLGKPRLGNTGIFKRQVSPYLFAGVGVVNSNPEVSVTNPDDEGLFPENDFTGLNPSFPLGIGVRADLFEFVSLGMEGGWRFTNTDYLDGVKFNGNPDGRDLYVYFGATLSFFLGAFEGFDF